MKKTIIFLTAAALLLGGVFAAHIIAAPSTEITLQVGNPIMTVNNEETKIDDEGTVPIIVNNRTLMPVRAIVEAMGGKVSWDGEKQQVTLVSDNNTILLTIDSTEAELNGKPCQLDTAPMIIGERTMLPIRFIAESFNYNVEWNDEKQEVRITSSVCTDSDNDGENTSASTNTEKKGKVLIAYFSQIDDMPEGSDAATYATPYSGNVRDAAIAIQKETGGDLFEIKTSQTYPQLHSECSKQAYQEQNDDYRPELTSHIQNMDEYDTVFVGFPIWVYVEPMAIRSFLEEYDFAGKRIIPYCVSMAVKVDGSVEDIKKLCPDAVVDNGNTFSTESDSSAKIAEWIKNLDI